jgi:hypothetical protein
MTKPAEAGTEPTFVSPEQAADGLAVEIDGVVDVAIVGQLALLAEMVDMRGRAAEQRCNLHDVERTSCGVAAGTWHMLGT